MLLSFLPGVRNWNKFTTRKDLQAINITFPFKKVLELYSKYKPANSILIQLHTQKIDL